MLRSFAGVAVSVAAMLVAAPASAATFLFASPLSPEASGATGSGNAQVVYDDAAHTLAVKTDWTGLSGATTVAHIHCCVASPGTAGVAVTPGTFPGFPTGLSAGSYFTLLDLTQTGTYTGGFLGAGTTADAEAKLIKGFYDQQAYLNIHTSTFGSGEIRGFLTAVVPEPQAWTLMIAGFGVIAAAMRRQRKRVALRFA
jgi:hypothetical protein